jgi:hypothetical protein
MVLLENFGAQPLGITLGSSIVVSRYAYCHERLRTYNATHSKVRKESHPERAEYKRGTIFSHLQEESELCLGNPLEIDHPILSTMAAPRSPAAHPAQRP